MSRRRNSPSQSETPEVEETMQELPKTESEVVEEEKEETSPVLQDISVEKIQATMHDKLSRKTDSDEENPFVPSPQLDKEVVEVAKEKGFPLSRGTEIGARLLARSQRINR